MRMVHRRCGKRNGQAARKLWRLVTPANPKVVRSQFRVVVTEQRTATVREVIARAAAAAGVARFLVPAPACPLDLVPVLVDAVARNARRRLAGTIGLAVERHAPTAAAAARQADVRLGLARERPTVTAFRAASEGHGGGLFVRGEEGGDAVA